MRKNKICKEERMKSKDIMNRNWNFGMMMLIMSEIKNSCKFKSCDKIYFVVMYRMD